MAACNVGVDLRVGADVIKVYDDVTSSGLEHGEPRRAAAAAAAVE